MNIQTKAHRRRSKLTRIMLCRWDGDKDTALAATALLAGDRYYPVTTAVVVRG